MIHASEMQPNKNNKQSNREKINTSWWTKGSFTIPPFPTCNDIEVLNSELKSSSFFIFPFSLFLRSNWRRYTIRYTIGIICRCPRPHTESEHMHTCEFLISFSFFPHFFLGDDLPIGLTTYSHQITKMNAFLLELCEPQIGVSLEWPV